MDTRKLNRLLPMVSKPARYTGGELNSIVKTNAKYRFALCFPDVYEIGMSHLGSRILYNVLNKREATACERAFAPWPDMKAKLIEYGLPLFSLETKRSLSEFDIVGFSILYEMSYTNILMMLELSQIPFYAKDRGEDMPLVICGGPCACNAEPLADFMDAVLFGDAEELINEFMDTYSKLRENGAKKPEILKALSRIEGVYIPSYYSPKYLEDGTYDGLIKLEADAPDTITRRVVMDLDNADYIGQPIVPFMNIVHDRVALELFRGCTQGCRFCQAGFIYRPVRERNKQTLMEQARQLTACTGYDEISLFSLSSGDYSAIHALVPEIIEEFKSQRVSVSLPSLRIDSFLKSDLEQMQEVRKAGLTFAPEAGTQRLRDVINKRVTEEDLLRSMQDAFEAGWDSVKLYFMIGLPTETMDDIQGIADLALKVSRLFYSMPKEKRQKGLRIRISAASFVPKPFTPFQWEPQNSRDEIVAKQQYLKAALKGIRGVEYAYHSPDISMLEAVFARGDRKLADVIVKAYNKGCEFDSWDEHFNRSAWQQAFTECGLALEQYAQRRRGFSEKLPWQHMDALIALEYLITEYIKAMSAECTNDCREGCNACFGDKNAYRCNV